MSQPEPSFDRTKTAASAAGRALKRARQTAGVSIEHCALKVGVPIERFQAWEQGRRLPPLDMLDKIGVALNATGFTHTIQEAVRAAVAHADDASAIEEVVIEATDRGETPPGYRRFRRLGRKL